MRIVKVIQLRVLPVDSQRILGEVIGPYAEEVHFFCQQIANHNCGRSLYHNALLYVCKRNFLFSQLFLYFLHNLLDLSYFLYRNDHRIHNGDRSKYTRPEQRPQLGLENIRLAQANTDRPVSHRRVFLMIQPEIIRLFIRANVQCPDNHFFARHHLSCLFICLKLFLLGREIVPANIKEFTSEQPDTSGVILQCIPNIADTADISIDFDFSSIQSYVFFPLHLLKDLLLFGFLTSPVPRPAADFL